MKKTGAQLAVYAMEQIGLKYTFGIPGVHNTELYDELNQSSVIAPLLTTHELGAAFIADAISRLSSETIGALMIVPAAGFTHAASGIGEAFLAGVPMLVVSGGCRTDTGKAYQLHGVDQMQLAAPLTKAAFRATCHANIIPMIYQAYAIARADAPGPVLVEIPVNLQIFAAEIDALPPYAPPPPALEPDPNTIRKMADMLLSAKKPGLFVGWGARCATEETLIIAERLQAPVATTLQGLASFPGDHPLHAGFGFGPAAVPAARKAFAQCDCLLAVGLRFSEISTGSYSAAIPKNLIHIDIDRRVIDANYPAAISEVGDAKIILAALVKELSSRSGAQPKDGGNGPAAAIARDKAAYHRQWLNHDSRNRVNPARFFDALRQVAPDDCALVLDDGNHTYLAAELFTIRRGGRFISPTDYNAMGYAVPAAIGAKIAAPDREVFAIVGDGCFTMTCMEILTAATHRLGVIYCVFHDGALSQIAQMQTLPYNCAPCAALPKIRFDGVALAVGAQYFDLSTNEEAATVLAQARAAAAQGLPVIINVAIDYSRKTAFTRGVSLAAFKGFPVREKMRFALRAVRRRLS